jgi:hypothetical protein
MENFYRAFVATEDYLSRWNNDHQPHPESWASISTVSASLSLLPGLLNLVLSDTNVSPFIGATTARVIALVRFVTRTNLKIALAVAAIIAGLMSIVTQNRMLKQLREENQVFRDQISQLQRVKEEKDRLSKRIIDASEVERQRKEHSELLRLRGEMAQLKREAAQVRGHKLSKQPHQRQWGHICNVDNGCR